MVAYLGGLTTVNADARIDWWRCTPVATTDYISTLDVVNLKYDATWQDPEERAFGGQLQLSTDSTFGTVLYTRNATGLTDGAQQTESFTGLTDNTRYFWRVRSLTPLPGTVYSIWSATQSFWVNSQAGNAVVALPIDVGASAQPNGAFTFDVNVGPSQIQGKIGLPIIMNIGPSATADGEPIYLLHNVLPVQGAGHSQPQYADFEVTTGTPTPHLWYLRPWSARETDGVVLGGYGFGDTQNEYSGVTLWKWEEGNEVEIPIVSWVSYPASVDAYTANRTIDPDNNHVDVAHHEITIIVPNGAVPPGYMVRVRTNGP